MRRCRIPYLVYSFKGGINCGIVTNGKVGTPHIVIDSRGDTDNGYRILGCKGIGPSEASVTAYYDKAIDISFPQVGCGCFAALPSQEPLTSGRMEYGSSALDDIAYIGRLQLHKIVVYQSFETFSGSGYGKTTVKGSPYRGPYAGVHSGGISPAGQNGYFFQDFTATLFAV